MICCGECDYNKYSYIIYFKIAKRAYFEYFQVMHLLMSLIQSFHDVCMYQHIAFVPHKYI